MSNNQQNNTNNQSRPNPFGSGTTTPSRFGTPQPTPASSPFGSRLPRFGRANLEWTVLPLTEAAIHVTLEGIGDPFHRILGKPLNLAYGQPEKVIEVLQEDAELLAELSAALDTAWETYQFKGATILYPWDENVRAAFTQPIQPVLPPPAKEEKKADDSEEADFEVEENAPELLRPQVACFRLIDPSFILNILARARTNVLVGNTPLALEPAFLQQSYICDDARLVAIARATGCIGELW